MICTICKKEFNSNKGLSSHLIQKHKVDKEKYYLENNKKTYCLLCGKDTKFISLDKGYNKFCSVKCSANSIETRNKYKDTCLNKYGINNTLNLEKSKQTLLNRYGVDHNFKSKEIREKIINTCIKKYGTINNIEKIKKTNLEKYGAENVFANEDIKQKIKNRNLEKYSVKNYRLSNEFKNKNKLNFYNKLFNSDRLKNLVLPLFDLSDYNNSKQIYRFKCLKCDNEFEDSLINGNIPRCEICFPLKRSNLENELYEFISNLYTKQIIRNDRTIIKPLELDLFLPKDNIAIEFDGLFHHSNNQLKDKNYHLNKMNLCKEKNIRLLHIFEDEWLNKKEIVENRLKHILKIDNSEKIFARKCNIKQIDSKSKNDFLELIHLQGKDISKINLGAFYNNELVSVMTFTQGRGSSKIKKIQNEYELSRFATSKNVIGIAGKLLQYFIKLHNPTRITTYADLRWSNGGLYEKLGMKFVSQTPPNYWYVINRNRIHRYNFRKNVLKEKLKIYDASLTEVENMLLNGYDRIFDCGNLKYEMIL